MLQRFISLFQGKSCLSVFPYVNRAVDSHDVAFEVNKRVNGLMDIEAEPEGKVILSAPNPHSERSESRTPPCSKSRIPHTLYPKKYATYSEKYRYIKLLEDLGVWYESC